MRRGANGFTLIELMVVLAIGSLLVALVPTAIDKLGESSQYRDTVRAVLVDLKRARHLANAYGYESVFQVDLNERKFGIVGGVLKSMPPSIEIRATVGRDDSPSQAQIARISFTPEGGSSGGTIELVRRSGAGARIRVDWLFGQITQEARKP